MSDPTVVDSALYYAQTYDVSVSDWPREIDFYRQLARQASSRGRATLELACGTGRVALRIARTGAEVVGLDRSVAMLDVARKKSSGQPTLKLVEGDMRHFELNQTFGPILMPGHSFQNLLTPEDQIACLRSINRHLVPGGLLVIHLDHQDLDWLGELMGDRGNVFEPRGDFVHPQTGRTVKVWQSWSYERSTQTAVLKTRWEEVDDREKVVGWVERGPIEIHCVFRFEMEHLLALAGYQLEAIYGDFFEGELTDASEEMIFVATRPDFDREGNNA